ncbi:MAG: pilus assembly protein [Oscillochloridaceae bacterium]|nr:pilus assembly protein [Chloroflexaceae bacterium]MDW8388976.1 pilus assembly protein [Oscillochloridaceae bacterium]
MDRRASGQSIVEMALILPFMLLVLFGIMEFGYLIWAYSTVSQAARNGAEAAAQVPPYESWLAYRDNPPRDADYPGFRGDACVNTVLAAVESDTTLFSGTINRGRSVVDFVTIRYPNGGNTRNLRDRGPIEVEINYPVTGLTPLYQLLRIGNSDGTITLRVVQRRSIENLGLDPTRPAGVACARNMAEWRELNR